LGIAFSKVQNPAISPTIEANMQSRKWKFRCVIYDCDGVLFDSIETNRRFFNHICTSIGRPPLTELELRYAHIHTVYEGIHFLCRNDVGLEEKALALLQKIDPQEYIPYLKMEPHLLPALKILREAGIFRAINTSRSTSMKYIMERFGLWPYFDLVITILDVKKPKPHPESIEKIMETFHVERRETVFVGDSEIDKQAADSAGVKFISYKNRDIAQDGIVIEDHLALLDFLPKGESTDPGASPGSRL
jgi:HAD superfamily hydrolase (TIGR01509 family)